MKGLKKITALLLISAVATFALAPNTVCALTIQERRQVLAAANSVSNTMKMILENYVGEEVTPEQLYVGAMRGMMSTLDGYSHFYSQDELQDHIEGVTGQYYGLGITISADEDGNALLIRVMNDSPAKQAGLMAGDIIREVYGVPVTYENVMDTLGDESQDVVELLVSRNDEVLAFSIAKSYLNMETVILEKLSNRLPGADDNNVGYIIITEFTNSTAEEFRAVARELQDMNITRVIIDLRGNTGGLLEPTIEICRLLVPEGVILTLVNKSGAAERIDSDLQSPTFEHIVVLTDESTASASEILVSAMKDSKAATVVGQTTFGKGVGQAMFAAEFGGAIDLTVLEFFSRDGNSINQTGVAPDITIDMPTYITSVAELDENGCSPTIIEVKQALAYLGYPVGAAGDYYDETTKKSVMHFQQENSIANDGQLGYDTVSAINIAIYYSNNDPALNKAYELIAP